MKHSWKIFSFLIAIMLMFSACDKDKYDVLANSKTGTAPALTASSSTIAPTPADSNSVAVTYSWSDPIYATDSAHQKYVIEIDTAGGNFENAIRKTVIGKLSAEFTAKEINSILLGYGFPFNVAKNMIVRVTSSYVNNNEQYHSNVLTSTMTPYKVPPKIALPTSGRLFIVGGGTDWGWSNDASPAFPAAREFTRVDETTYVGIFNLKANDAYKLLQEQGNWSTQFHALAGGTPEAGSFEQKDADPSFPTPATAGLYKITIDFQTGKYSVVPYTKVFTGNVWAIGDATPVGWDNSLPNLNPTQFTQLTNAEFQLVTNLAASGGYLFLPTAGNWDHKYGGDNAATGSILFDGEVPGSNTPPPAVAGTYKITLNFATNKYTVVKQ